MLPTMTTHSDEWTGYQALSSFPLLCKGLLLLLLLYTNCSNYSKSNYKAKNSTKCRELQDSTIILAFKVGMETIFYFLNQIMQMHHYIANIDTLLMFVASLNREQTMKFYNGNTYSLSSWVVRDNVTDLLLLPRLSIYLSILGYSEP